jgi:Predicted membrane protein
MAFCTGCGADVTGKSFCIQCGKSVAAGASSAAAVAAPSVSTAPKKISPIVWILVGIFGLFVVLGIALTAGAAFVAHKVKQNPALAIAKLATVGNPDLEAVAADEGANTVTFKDKRTGETVTMNFDDVKKGKIVFKSNGKEATIQAHGEGQNGTLEINSPDGTVKIGAGADGNFRPGRRFIRGSLRRLRSLCKAAMARADRFSSQRKIPPRPCCHFTKRPSRTRLRNHRQLHGQHGHGVRRHDDGRGQSYETNSGGYGGNGERRNHRQYPVCLQKVGSGRPSNKLRVVNARSRLSGWRLPAPRG